MGRLRVTPKGKVKKNIPITRIGRKAYKKRRFAHVRKLETAGKQNPQTVKYHKRGLTAAQNYTRVGLAIDPSQPQNVMKEQKKRIRERTEVEKFQGPEAQKGSIGQPVSTLEGTMITNLIEKYGNNYKKMAQDCKLNPMQLNARVLQRRVLNYLKLERVAFAAEYEKAKNELGVDLSEGFAGKELRKRRIGGQLDKNGKRREAEESN